MDRQGPGASAHVTSSKNKFIASEKGKNTSEFCQKMPTFLDVLCCLCDIVIDGRGWRKRERETERERERERDIDRAASLEIEIKKQDIIGDQKRPEKRPVKKVLLVFNKFFFQFFSGYL